MRQLLTILGCVTILLSGSAFLSSTHNKQLYPDPAVYKIMEVTYLWNFLHEGYEPDYDNDGTWLDVGFRSKYAKAKKYASLEMLEIAFGSPVFVRGPHTDKMNYESNTSFGYYNPEFISSLEAAITTALANPKFKIVAKRIYDQHLASMAKTYHASYTFLQDEHDYVEELEARYLREMARPDGVPPLYIQEEFRTFAENLEREKEADIYEAFTAPSFWLRRSIDGTAPQLFSLLERVMKEME